MKRYARFSSFIESTAWIPVLTAIGLLIITISAYIKSGYESMFLLFIDAVFVLIAIAWSAMYAVCVITDHIIAHIEDRKGED